MTSIFSTYSTGENRVTASCLAVLRSMSLDRIERILGALLEQSEFELVRFQNQPSKGTAGVPDAIIESNLRILIETKTERNTVNLPQIKRHLARLGEQINSNGTLLVLSPDESRPVILDSVGDNRVAWSSFMAFSQIIDDVLSDPTEVMSEREAFLLRELQAMFEAEGLLASPNDVVVVAARNAWPEYNQLHAYVCQPGRSFQHVKYLAFYSHGVIHPLVPRILAPHDKVEIQRNVHKGELGLLVDRLLDEQLRPVGQQFKVFLLTAPNSPDRVVLPQPIPNDKLSSNDKPVAFTMGQRYTTLARLYSAKTTSELD